MPLAYEWEGSPCRAVLSATLRSMPQQPGMRSNEAFVGELLGRALVRNIGEDIAKEAARVRFPNLPPQAGCALAWWGNLSETPPGLIPAR